MKQTEKTAGMCVVIGLLLACNAVFAVAPPQDMRIPVKAGAYYFDGWTGKTDSWHLPPRLQNEFGHRKPIWGWVTSTPEVMRKQIDAAADHGVRFFAFCWYFGKGPQKDPPLNNALKLFQEAPNQKRMEFCLLVANHPGWSIGPEDWDECCERWLQMFKHPSYVRANGAPLIIFHSPSSFSKAFGGPKGVRDALDSLREKAKAEGLPGVSVAGCWTARNVGPGQTLPENEVVSGYDFVTGYSMPHYCAWDWPKIRQPFQHLVDGHKEAWRVLSEHSKLPIIPITTLGWDPRPWLPENKEVVYYPDRSPEGVESMVANAVQWINKNPQGTTREKLLIMYAWNEYGEGAYLTPTERDGDAYLQAVKRGLYSERAEAHGAPSQGIRSKHGAEVE